MKTVRLEAVQDCITDKDAKQNAWQRIWFDLIAITKGDK